MTTTHFILRYAHISMGALTILSGAAAMILRKGSPLHRRAGVVFFASMLIMAASGVIISIFITPIMGNVMGGSLAFYLTLTAWAAAWRPPGVIGRLETGTMLMAFGIAIAGAVFGQFAAASAGNRLHGSGPIFYYIAAGGALLGAALDARMIARGGFTGSQRTARHLSRMCIAMFMATGSFFLGQARLLPPAVRETKLNTVPVLLVIGALVFWMIRIRLLPAIRRARTQRRAVVPVHAERTSALKDIHAPGF